jgi:hypothetical protein
MIVGSEQIAETAAKVLEAIGRDAADELVEVDEVFVIVAVHYGAVEGEDAETGSAFYRCTSARVHVQLGLVEQARRAIDATVEPFDRGDG